MEYRIFRTASWCGKCELACRILSSIDRVSLSRMWCQSWLDAGRRSKRTCDLANGGYMEIQDLGAIGEFISSIAIVITLIFLVLETRRSRTATQQSNRQARQRIRTDLSLAAAVNPQFAELMAKTLPSDPVNHLTNASEFNLSLAEGIQFYNYTLAYFRYLEDQFFSDLPETDRFSLESQVRIVPSNPYFTKYWEERRSDFNPRFQVYVDEMIQ